ncbi:hypothetical protein WMY93_008577 [Mugilogobius chulae]|uniref:Endothelin-like toxin domain-containing protein n=1 Tax=Mugilogobius chulae TaxID=88201 RepID=A0AAW0PJE9_9GOBI
MSPNANILLLFSLWASVQEGFGLPVMKEQTEDSGGAPASPGVRSKRCACSSLLDSECHYFCHLDIIWVNTPSKTSIYGLGMGPSRRRRSTTRCSCANPDDNICSSFCQRVLKCQLEQQHQRRLFRK